MKSLVLDTSAFIMGFNPSGPVFSVEAVENELSKGTMAELRFRMAKEKGILSVRHPSPDARGIVEEASAKAGEKGFLSIADRDVLALALDLKQSGLEPIIVSDDYAVQNLAEHLRLEYGSLANFGIVHKFHWIMYCPACGRRFKQPDKTCRVCGTELKRKVLSKTKLGRPA